MLDLTNRKECFYWQTDRNLTPEDFERIFLKRHQTSEEDILAILKNGITSFPTASLSLVALDENVVKGNVNIVRKILIHGKEFVVRMHPRGVKNGYIYVEKIALALANQFLLPVPEILEIHEAKHEDDMDFVLMTKAEGVNMDVFLSKDKSSEETVLMDAGKIMARLHSINVDGFGCFDNAIARKEGRLVGLHTSNKEFMVTALHENLERLVQFSVSTKGEADRMKRVIEQYTFEPKDGPVLVHNDFADWNLLTDGEKITAILDWDECCGGDPVADLACWSMFFTLERYNHFLAGYASVKKLPEDYEERFHYYRLRYAISKMALRAKRFLVDNSEFMKDKIAVGKKALHEELVWFSS